MKEPDVCVNLVVGEAMLCTGSDFLTRAKVLLEREQQSATPDTALIDFICEAVRLWREYEGQNTPVERLWKGIKPYKEMEGRE